MKTSFRDPPYRSMLSNAQATAAAASSMYSGARATGLSRQLAATTATPLFVTAPARPGL